jgi:alpha-1,3-glucan synthase
MRLKTALWGLPLFATFASSSPYRDDLADYNLNVNKNAQAVTDYDSTRPNTTYTPSPKNWRALPTYTILLDKFADGDPTNNDFFGTQFEYDHRETQLRYGGDLQGLVSRLDYLQGMGIKLIFMSGTPFLNMIWQADSNYHLLSMLDDTSNVIAGYSPLDFSVLDPHWGNINDWRSVIDQIHARGMYFMADFTVGTMGDLIGIDGYVRYTSQPFFLYLITSPPQTSQYKYTFQFERI